MKFIHLTKENNIDKNDFRNSQEATSQSMQKKKVDFFLGKKLNLVLFIRCFKYLLCNEIYSSNRERERLIKLEVHNMSP